MTRLALLIAVLACASLAACAAAPSFDCVESHAPLATPRRFVRDIPIEGDVVVPLGADVSGGVTVARVVTGPVR